MAMKKAGKGPAIQFPKGGPSGKMTGKKVLAQAPGVTSAQGKASGGKFPVGGKGHMAGKGSASPARPK